MPAERGGRGSGFPRDKLRGNPATAFGPVRIRRGARAATVLPMDAVIVTEEQEVDALEDELAAVVRWRFGQLARCGYALDDAIVIACHPEVDLHQAVELVLHGCPPETALRILL